MTPKTLKSLLLSKTRPAQLLLAMSGAFLGLSIVTGGLHTFRIIQELLNQKELLGGDYIVISKKVGLLNTISGSTPAFDDQDIAEVKKIEGVTGVGKFESGDFRASMELTGALAEMAGHSFRSDMFFEALPDDFVDVDKQDWSWNLHNAKVPVIVSAEYINLYNSAFARSQNLPVIPESMLKSISFNIQITGNGQSEWVPGKIVGFSKRINSILVPKAFLDYANSKYGAGKNPKPSRLMLYCKDPASPALANALKASGFELNEEKLKSSELNGILQIMISVVSVIGLLIVLLAMLGFMQYNQLMAYRSAYEIQTLHWLGYSTKQISKPYIFFTLRTLFFTFSLCALAVVLANMAFVAWLRNLGFDNDFPSLLPSIGLGFVISLLIAGISALAAQKQVKQLAQ